MSVLYATLWGALGAVALLIGSALTIYHEPSKRITGIIMAFGSGTLISAIAYELIPESTLGRGFWIVICFLFGALTFFAGDWYIDRMGGAHRKDLTGGGGGGSGMAIFLGTLLDGVPESMILGISIGLGGSVSVAFLFAVFISNLPEGVAGTVCLQAEGRSNRRIIMMWTYLLLASAAAAGLACLFTKEANVIDGVYLQAFAAGAMLTMLADTMMPEAFEHGGKVVGLFTVLGFLAAAIISVLE